jgi:hypothetical protein
MNFAYEQATGELYLGGTSLGICYSGRGAGLNNPALQNAKDVGPIPQGWYTIRGFFDDPGGKGPIVAHLIPDEENAMYGRGGFMIHGDNAQANHTASEGCIIASHTIRLEIAAEVAEGTNRLQVVQRLSVQ